MGIRVFVDWDKNGNFTGTYDDITDDVKSASWFLGARSPYQSVCDEPTLKLVLRNTDGKYSPENGSSVIAGKIKPYTRIRVIESVSNTEMWNGYIDSLALVWQPTGVYTGKDAIMLTCVGAKQLLDRVTVTQAVFTDARGDEIIEDALEQAGVFLVATNAWQLGVVGFSELGVTTFLASPGIWRSFDEGITTFPVYGGGRENVWSIIRDVTETERGRFYIDRTGRYIWKNRHHTYLNDTFSYTLTDGNTKLNSVDYIDGTKAFFNSITVNARPRSTETSETLWTLENPIQISAGQTVSLEARLRRSNGQYASATSLSTSSSFSSGTATITVTARGGTADIAIENSTLNTAVLATLVLSGIPSFDQNELTVLVTDQDSIDDYGKREKQFSVGNLNEYRNISDIGHMELLRLQLKPSITSVGFICEDNGVDNSTIISDLPIGTFIEINANSTLYHTNKYIVVGEEHNWQSPNIHTARIFLEPVTPTGFVLDTVGRMELDGAKTVLIY